MRIFFKYTVFYSTHFPSEGNHSNNRQCCFKDMLWFPKFSKSTYWIQLPIFTHYYECKWKKKKKVCRLQRPHHWLKPKNCWHKRSSCVLVCELHTAAVRVGLWADEEAAEWRWRTAQRMTVRRVWGMFSPHRKLKSMEKSSTIPHIIPLSWDCRCQRVILYFKVHRNQFSDKWLANLGLVFCRVRTYSCMGKQTRNVFRKGLFWRSWPRRKCNTDHAAGGSLNTVQPRLGWPVGPLT